MSQIDLELIRKVKLNYMHNNPVGVVDKAEEYVYSSAGK